MNYALDTVTSKRVKKSVEHILHPVTSFSVTYTPATDSATLELSGSRKFPTGGELTVLAGVTGDSGAVLTGTTVFTITAGGKKIVPT